MRISLPFSLKFFALVIKYKAELYLYSIIVPIKDDLSPQEVNLRNLSLNFEMMSQDWVCEIVFSTELVEYLGGRRQVYGMGKVSSRLGGMALLTSSMG